MNKNDLIEALTPRLGGRAAAALAVESVVDVVLRQVAAGGTVSITGFGTFEPVERAPRTGRNPHTGEAVPIPAARTPRFRPGTYFKGVVADPDRLPTSGLAGARVGTADDDTSGSSAHRSGSTGQGAPPTIRRPAGATKPARARKKSEPASADPERRRSRTGTPATVRAGRPEPEAAPAAEPGRERRSRRTLTIGGQEITRDMITAKKAQLARAKNDHVVQGAGTASGAGAKDRHGKQEKQEKKDKKDKKATMTAKGTQSAKGVKGVKGAKSAKSTKDKLDKLDKPDKKKAKGQQDKRS